MPNRQQRRQFQREERRKQKKLNATSGIFLKCPDCDSKDLKKLRGETFRCMNCGSKHDISELAMDM